jgi:hypothetical protein
VYGLGLLYQQVGQRAGASAVLADAVGLFDAMGMTHWLERARTALADTV